MAKFIPFPKQPLIGVVLSSNGGVTPLVDARTRHKRDPKKFWCVYEHGLAIYSHASLTQCLRHIAKRMGGLTSNTTMGQAYKAGYEVRAV